MGLITKDTFVCLDCESTGLDPKTDRLIEIAAIRFNYDGILEERQTLVNPECDIPPKSQEIHNISKEMLLDKPKIKEVLPDFLKLIGKDIIMGHGINFDISLIMAEAERSNIPCTIGQNPHLDTLRMARYYGKSPINSLAALREHFNIEPQGAHRAMSDVIVNIEVFKALAKSFKTTEDLFLTLQKPIKLRAMPLGKYKGQKFEEIPLDYLIWSAKKDFDQDLLYSIRSEIRNRKNGGNAFLQSNNPFSKK